MNKKIKKVTGLMKNGKGGKIITKFASTAPKCHSYCVKNDDREVEDSQFIRAKLGTNHK